ncbi:hypothetical protein LINGRAHAP2_LOCUS5129 [Linum grandiflorum]
MRTGQGIWSNTPLHRFFKNRLLKLDLRRRIRSGLFGRRQPAEPGSTWTATATAAPSLSEQSRTTTGDLASVLFYGDGERNPLILFYGNGERNPLILLYGDGERNPLMF